MSIIDRGRGPEIAGTRITVYRVMDYLRGECSPSAIAAALDITGEQVQLALDYIDSHKPELDSTYQLILSRANQSNPPEVDEGCATTYEELRRRITERQVGEGVHDRPVRQ